MEEPSFASQDRRRQPARRCALKGAGSWRSRRVDHGQRGGRDHEVFDCCPSVGHVAGAGNIGRSPALSLRLSV